MRLYCHFCGKSVSTEVNAETIIRALLICPECIEDGRVIIPDEDEPNEPPPLSS